MIAGRPGAEPLQRDHPQTESSAPAVPSYSLYIFDTVSFDRLGPGGPLSEAPASNSEGSTNGDLGDSLANGAADFDIENLKTAVG